MPRSGSLPGWSAERNMSQGCLVGRTGQSCPVPIQKTAVPHGPTAKDDVKLGRLGVGGGRSTPKAATTEMEGLLRKLRDVQSN